MSNPAIILAAGEARRFGRPKQCAEFGDRSLLERAVATVRAARLEPLVVLGAHREAVESELDETCRRVVAEEWEEGMGASIRRAARAISPDEIQRVTVVACDQPLVTHLDLRLLNQKCATADAAAAVYEGVAGIPACFDARMLGELEELEGDRGARWVLRGDEYRVAAVPMDHAGVDIDTPDDLEELTSTDNRGSR